MCLFLAAASLALQLAGAAWRLLGQLAAAEQLLFALLRPAWLHRAHTSLAGALVSLGRGMQRLALVDAPLLRGGWLCCGCWAVPTANANGRCAPRVQLAPKLIGGMACCCPCR